MQRIWKAVTIEACAFVPAAIYFDNSWGVKLRFVGTTCNLNVSRNDSEVIRINSIPVGHDQIFDCVCDGRHLKDDSEAAAYQVNNLQAEVVLVLRTKEQNFVWDYHVAIKIQDNQIVLVNGVQCQISVMRWVRYRLEAIACFCQERRRRSGPKSCYGTVYGRVDVHVNISRV
jgi:hypothetical protein